MIIMLIISFLLLRTTRSVVIKKNICGKDINKIGTKLGDKIIP